MGKEHSCDPLIKGIHHVTLLVTDVETSLGFYQGLLGLSVDMTRPAMDFPGAWLQIAEQQIHLIELPHPSSSEATGHGGRDRHVAFEVPDLTLLRQRLEERGVALTLSRSGRRALFCRDPDGNALEFVEVTAENKKADVPDFTEASRSL